MTLRYWAVTLLVFLPWLCLATHDLPRFAEEYGEQTSSLAYLFAVWGWHTLCERLGGVHAQRRHV